MPGAAGLRICTLTSDTSWGSSDLTITVFTWPNWSPPMYLRLTPGGHDSAPVIHNKQQQNNDTEIEVSFDTILPKKRLCCINMWTERHAPHLSFVFSRFSWTVCPEEQTLLRQSSHPQQRTWMECWRWDFQSHNMHRWQPAGSWSNTKKEGHGVSLRRVEKFSEGLHCIALYVVTWLWWRAKSRLRTGSKEKIWQRQRTVSIAPSQKEDMNTKYLHMLDVNCRSRVYQPTMI